MEVLSKIAKELWITSVIVAMTIQQLPNSLWNQDSICIKFECPIVIPESTILKDFVPHFDEHRCVQCSHVPATTWGVKVGINDSGLDSFCICAENLFQGTITDDQVVITTENAHTIFEFAEQ